MQDSVQPEQQPADAEAQQQAKHQVHLLLGHTVTHKVVLRRVHQRMVPIVRDYIVDMMPAATEKENAVRFRCAKVKIGVQRETLGFLLTSEAGLSLSTSLLSHLLFSPLIESLYPVYSIFFIFL